VLGRWDKLPGSDLPVDQLEPNWQTTMLSCAELSVD
jgi:hypothetical protein